jgi:hypothetical protein
LVFVAVFLYFFYFKSKKIEPEEEHHKEKNQEKILPIKTEKKSTKSINKYLDLHLHLDGAITKEIAIKLAKIQNIELPTNNEEELENLLSVRPDCESLNDFLKCFALPLSLMQTPLGLSLEFKSDVIGNVSNEINVATAQKFSLINCKKSIINLYIFILFYSYMPFSTDLASICSILVHFMFLHKC